MMRGVVCGISVGIILCGSAGAQGPDKPLQLASREPAFYAIVGTHIERAEAGSFSALRARLVLRLHDATIPEALTAIQEQTALRFTYKPSILPAGATVRLDAADITVAAALTQILLDADVDVEIAPYGQATLVARHRVSARSQPPDTVVVRGTVTDSSTHAPISGVAVRVAGTNKGVVTGPDGIYSITGLVPGTYKLLVRRLGYAVVTVEVTAGTVGVYTQNVALTTVPTVLDRVVTTVTGNQRLSTIGNTISTINVDSLVPNTPVTTLSDVINARAPGVQVINPGGLTGASPYIYIRGPGSLTLSMQPLLYIDGVRVANSTATIAGNETQSGRFNDLTMDEIQSIEIVKGPSAATLYGTDAANGVIVVTTKQGVAGAPRWNMHVEGGALTIDPDQFGYNYTGWGHSAGQVTTACTLVAAAAQQCRQDSVTKFDPLRVPGLTPLGTGNRADIGMQVSGGGTNVRYFVSGDYASEVGYLKDDAWDQHLLDSIVGPAAGTGAVRHPNAVSKYDGRVNLTAPLGHDGDVTLSASYLSENGSIPYAGAIQNWAGGVGYRDPLADWSIDATPGLFFASIERETNQHFTGGVTARWRPAQWFTGRATVGVDATASGFSQVTPATAAPLTFVGGGNVIDTRGTTDIYSVDVGGTARTPLLSFLVANTSLGVQYHRAETNTATATATSLLTGATSVSGGVSQGAQVDSEGVVAGVYAEEQLSIGDRLFLTGAVRVDGANDFGHDFQSAVYPKGSVSWLISREPFFPAPSWLTLLRLRAAYGESGTQPGEVLTTYSSTPVTIDGTVQPGMTLSTLANSHVQPERQKEIEAGADLDLADSRVHLEFTYYRKRNVNALYNVPLGSSLGSVNSILENVGTILNWGYEAQLSAVPLNSRLVSWDVIFNGSVNHNQVVTLGPYFQPYYGGNGTPSIVAGYPIYSLFAQPYTYRDTNGDGIIEPNEVNIQNFQRFYGPTIPPVQITAGTHIGVFNNRIRVGALFDYRGQFVIPNNALEQQCGAGVALGDVSRQSSLADQAVCVSYNGNVYTTRGFISNGAFLRFRELSLTYTAPDALAHQFRARSLSLTLSARNVALWTHFSGGDPETAPSGFGPASETYFAGGGLPPAQYWLARINLGF
jgi:TonB-linked SusC/RagA family outer membrane protein